MRRDELGRAIYRAAHLEGEFRLRSGAVAREYFDKYLFEGRPLRPLFTMAELAVAAD